MFTDSFDSVRSVALEPCGRTPKEWQGSSRVALAPPWQQSGQRGSRAKDASHLFKKQNLRDVAQMKNDRFQLLPGYHYQQI